MRTDGNEDRSQAQGAMRNDGPEDHWSHESIGLAPDAPTLTSVNLVEHRGSPGSTTQTDNGLLLGSINYLPLQIRWSEGVNEIMLGAPTT